MIVELDGGDFDGAAGQVVQKSTVVGDQDNRAGTLQHEIFEPLDAFEVEVIRGLVE